MQEDKGLAILHKGGFQLSGGGARTLLRRDGQFLAFRAKETSCAILADGQAFAKQYFSAV
jgi:hypothetical protein